MNEKLRQRLLQVFQAEHADHLHLIRQVLESTVERPLSADDLNEVFRRAHSLKGAARAVDLGAVETLAHHVETLFARVQAGEMSLDRKVIEIIHQVLDRTEELVQAAALNQDIPGPGPVLNTIEELLGFPKTEQIEIPEKSADTTEVLSEQNSGSEETTPWNDQGEHLRISAGRLEGLLESSDRLNLESQRQGRLEQGLRQFTTHVLALEQRWQIISEGLAEHPLVPELQRELLALKNLGQQVRLEQQKSSWTLGQEVHLLQNAMQGIRMMPVRTLFQTFPRMIRTLAREQGKEVRCKFTGLEIEADRAVLQAIKDPVMHVLRNAVAHGIEEPEIRLAAGKDPTGLISCQIKVQGHHLIIQIQDDGRGLDLGAIREKLQESDPEKLEREDWSEVIFQAGFSTAAGITELRGRGMGLSVVAETVQQVQGKCRLIQSQSPGLCLELELPLQIATHRLLVFEVCHEVFALPTYSLKQLLRVNATEIQMIEGRTVLLYEDQAIPFFCLSQLLFQQASSLQEQMPVLLLKTAHGLCALAVDAFLTDRESVLKPLTGPAAELPLYLGATLSLAGTVIPVLDPHALSLLSQNSQQRSFSSLQIQSVELMPLILVVDDSITTRTLEKSILETQGYRVQVAVNGREALDKLAEQNFDLVITDVQMPEMNGLELLEKMKQDQRLTSIPVIMVTSLNEKQDREKGLQLGADAYLVKQKFEQQELLEVIQQIL